MVRNLKVLQYSFSLISFRLYVKIHKEHLRYGIFFACSMGGAGFLAKAESGDQLIRAVLYS